MVAREKCLNYVGLLALISKNTTFQNKQIDSNFVMSVTVLIAYAEQINPLNLFSTKILDL